MGRTAGWHAPMSQKDVDRIKLLNQQGVESKFIAERMGITYNSVRRIINEVGPRVGKKAKT